MGEQKRVFRLIPALQEAEFVRYGVMHRNTFINSPTVLEPSFQFRQEPRLFLAGQITGWKAMWKAPPPGFWPVSMPPGCSWGKSL